MISAPEAKPPRRPWLVIGAVLAAMLAGWVPPHLLAYARVNTAPDGLAVLTRQVLQDLGYPDDDAQADYRLICCEQDALAFLRQQDRDRRSAIAATHQPPIVRFLSNKRGYSATFGRELAEAGFDPRDVMDKSELSSVVVPAVAALFDRAFPLTLQGKLWNEPAPAPPIRRWPISPKPISQPEIEHACDLVLWRIGDSMKAPAFRIVSQPNEWTERARETARAVERGEMSELGRQRLAYWRAFREFLDRHPSPLRIERDYASGHMSFGIPDSPFILVAYRSVRGPGVFVRVRADEPDQVRDALQPLRSEIERISAQLGSRHGVAVTYDAADMTKPDAIGAMLEKAIARFGAVDVLINNAGIQHVAPVDEFPPEKWDAILAINLSYSFHTVRAALPAMKARRWGRIVNIASAHGLVGSPYKSAYVAAKHGMLGLTKVTALETAEQGVTCNAICPGYVYTPLVEMQIEGQAKAHGIPREQVIREVLLAQQPNKRFATTDELGGIAVFLASDAAASITGAAIPVDGGWTAH